MSITSVFYLFHFRSVCDALRDLASFVQFKKRENHHGENYQDFLK